MNASPRHKLPHSCASFLPLIRIHFYVITSINMIEFKTSLGDFSIELFPTEAPISSDNFQAYVDAGYFDGTIFHRVIPGFVLQGGGFTADMQQKKTNEPIKNEATNGLKNKRGTLSMARTNDINSATSQFFVNLVDNEFLDNKAGNYGYAVFGKVVSGMDVIDAIAKVKTGRKGHHDDVPVDAVIVHSAKTVG
jgi:cyclophilin family peptidyl-prolyl cis-trans isomerase